MKWLTIFRFELQYQVRNVVTWIYFAISFLFSFWLTSIGETTDETTYFNAPAFLIFVTVFSGAVWLLVAGAISGHAASRDVQTQMHALTYTTPVSKFEYLGGRFLAAFVLNTLIQLTIPAGFFLSFYTRDIDPALLAPFRPDMYLTTFFYLSMPLAFFITACQFSVAVLEGRAIASYIVSVLLFPIASHFIGMSVAKLVGEWEIAKLVDLVGITTVAAIDTWTPFEKNTRLINLEGTFLWNRVIWLSIAMGFLSYAYFRFQFTHHAERVCRIRILRRRKSSVFKIPGSKCEVPHSGSNQSAFPHPKFAIPTFGLATHVRQARAIAWSSFSMIVKSRTGLTIVGLYALHLIVFATQHLRLRGVPQYPTTMNILTLLTPSMTDPKTPLVIIPILIVFYAGELVWRERETGLNKISDTVPVSEWVFFLGKLSGLSLVIMVWQLFLMMAGILNQVFMGYSHFEVEVYLKALFGFQLTNYILFALLALVVHAIVNQKYLGHLAILIVYLSMAFHSRLGIEHNLLIYGSDPGWFYTDMRGFGPYLKPWLWFKLYWAAWAVLFAVAARLLWVRSMSQDFRIRIQLTRHRFTRATAMTAAVAVGLLVISGAYILYNTNVVNDYTTDSERAARHARYEQYYGRYKHIAQPLLAGTRLHIEIYPRQKKADIRGIYNLVNKTDVPIDSIHLATAWNLETGAVTFDRPSLSVAVDKALGHEIHVLEKPLQPGDSLRLSFVVHFNSPGFRHTEIDVSVIDNGTYFINQDWLPAIGYQPNRELENDGDRKQHGLVPWAYPSLHDTAAYQVMPGQELIDFEAVVGTAEGQIAVAPGALLRKWTENGRSYFHYATSAPIRNTYSFFSANYASQEVTWNDTSAGSNREVTIKVYHHPSHAENIGRIVQSVQAALSYFTEKFGPYPYSHITIVERSGYAGQLNAEATAIDYGESFTLWNQHDHPGDLDIVYFAIAHEVAHQWWGAAQIFPAHVEGGVLLSETLANYSGLKVLEQTYGGEQVRMLLSMWRDSYEVPRSRFATPLLRATDAFLGYRKGPLALYALTRYTGKDCVNDALRQFVSKHTPPAPPLPTALDLYRELKAVTPDSLDYLLQDYFEKNIYWQFKMVQSTARQIDSARWEVTLRLHANKVMVDSTGAEISLPMNDWVEVGIFAPRKKGERWGKPFHLQKHRIRSGEQTITVSVPGKPARAGIDPYNLLIDLNPDNNTSMVKIDVIKDLPDRI